MTPTFEVDELASRLPEMLAEVEAGHEVLIARGAKPVARVQKEPRHDDSDDMDTVVASIRANRKNFAPVTIEEIIDWKNEGRR